MSIPSLLKKFEGTKERVGFILHNASVIEVENVCDDPENGFDVKASDIALYGDDASATWHTHPGATSELSVGDLNTFRQWPTLEHYIIGTDGISRYYIKDGMLLHDPNFALSRPVESDQSSSDNGACLDNSGSD